MSKFLKFYLTIILLSFSALGDIKEENIAEKSLANVRQEFVYKIVDEAYKSNYPSYPNKFQINIIGAILGSFLAALFSLILYFFRNLN